MAWFVAGPSGVGKSTQMQSALSCLNQEMYAFQTRLQREGEQWLLLGCWRAEIPARSLIQEPEWQVLARGSLQPGCGIQVEWQNFDSYAPDFDAVPNGAIVLLDELGFMESKALEFQRAVLNLLERPVHLVGVIKALPKTEFLHKLHYHPGMRIQEVTEANRTSVAFGCLRKLQPLWIEAVELKPGLSAWIGGGGKTHSIYRAAQELVERGSRRVVVATSTHMQIPEHTHWIQSREAWEKWLQTPDTECVNPVIVGDRSPEGKLQSPAFVGWDELRRKAEYVLVEADGSRCLPLKAHDPSREPVIPEQANQVFAVAGLTGMGQPVRSVLHRAETFGGFSDSNPVVDAALWTEILLRHPKPDAWIWNQVDTCQDLDAIRSAARSVSQKMGVRVLLGSLRAQIPVYEVWEDGRCLY